MKTFQKQKRKPPGRKNYLQRATPILEHFQRIGHLRVLNLTIVHETRMRQEPTVLRLLPHVVLVHHHLGHGKF